MILAREQSVEKQRVKGSNFAKSPQGKLGDFRPQRSDSFFGASPARVRWPMGILREPDQLAARPKSSCSRSEAFEREGHKARGTQP